MNRSPWTPEEVDGSPWRLEEVDGGDEQYSVESRFAVRHNPPVGDIPRGVNRPQSTTRPDLAVYLRPRWHLAIHRRPAQTRRFTSNLTEHYDSLVTRWAG